VEKVISNVNSNITKRTNIIVLLIVMCVSFLCSNLFKENTVSANEIGMGDISFSWNREIANDVMLDSVISTNNYGEQKGYTITFDPVKTSSYMTPYVTYGNYVMGGENMTDMVNKIEAQGKKVVFGINGDAYDTSNGVSLGIMISNGKFTSSPDSSYGIGFKADGSVVYGNTSFNITAACGSNVIKIDDVNKERKMDTEAVTLLTEEFASSSLSSLKGIEVVLKVADNQIEEELKIGKQMNLVVESVVEVDDNENKNNTTIGKGKMILSCNTASSRYNQLKQLTVGENVAVNVENTGTDFSEVVQAMGVFHVLMVDNVVTSGIENNLETHPRTAIGLKANGEMVLFQCDGRQVGWANGITFSQLVDYMKSLGCVTVFNLDGGGSSTIAATLPGDSTTTTLNRPSDGIERANCNALLFVTDLPTTDIQAEKVHIYPDMEAGYASKVMVLENGKLSFKVKATDSNYFAASLENQQLKYEVINDTSKSIGTIDENGKFTASAGSGTGKIRVTLNNSAYSEIDIEVVDEVTKITTDVTIISIAPNKTKQMTFNAEYNGIPVICSSDALTFKLSNDTLGIVTTDGIFTSADTQGTGELTISYKDYILTLPLEVGKLPYLINDFEDEIEGSNWGTNYIMRGGSAKISINHNEKYIKSGDGSLRIDYDFATIPLTGTTAVEFYEKPSGTELIGQPTAIGCWVYGDGNGGWLRIQLSGGKFVGDTYINWIGWKYIETPIPTDAPFPYVLVKAVRLLGTTSVCNYKKGTIYVDSLRAIYDFRNDDETAPIIEESSISPLKDSLTTNKSQVISFTAKDVKSEGLVYSGINTSRTQLYINGKLINNIIQAVNEDGSVTVTYNPSALTLLRAGKQKIKVRIEDNFGNKTFKEWMFTVDGYAVELEESIAETEKIYAGQSFSYIINPTSYKNFLYYDYAMTFNPSNLTLVSGDVEIDSRLTVQNKIIDLDNGIISFKISGMDVLTKDDNVPMIKVNFKANDIVGGMTDILVTKSIIKETGKIDTEEIVLEGMDLETDYLYTISQKGSTYNSNTVFTVTSKGESVENVSFIVKKDDEILTDFNLITDANGQINTTYFGLYDIGTVFYITAIKDGCLSNETKLTVYDSLGTSSPQRIMITTCEDPSSQVGISWETTKWIEDSNIIIGIKEDLSDALTLKASSRIITTISGGYDREYLAWGVRISDLTPITTYYYKVGNEIDGWSNIYNFKTAKASGDITIAYYGDIQGKYENFPSVINQVNVLTDEVDLSVLAGDVVDVSNQYNNWTALDSSNSSYFNSSIWAATMGNHDSDYEGQAFTSYFYGALNGVEGSNGADNYFTVGDAIIFNFNTEATYSYDKDFTKQKALLKEVMSKTDKTYKIVLMHRSAYPLNYDEQDIRNLSSTFEECGIDLVLSGHDHIYSRTSMFNNEKIAYNNGVTYVVGGCSSGSKYYDASLDRNWSDIVYDDNNPVFSIFKITDAGILFNSYAIENGKVTSIDTFTVLPSAKANITSNNGDINYTGKIALGESKEFEINPSKGYQVKSVTVNGINAEVKDNKFTVAKATSQLNININYEKAIYTVTIKSENGTVAGAKDLDYEAKETYTITPDKGYQVKNVKVNGNLIVVKDNKFTLAETDENLSIEVNYETIKSTGCNSNTSESIYFMMIAMLAVVTLIVISSKKRITK
jgi:exopolysaccharide biosynthesis protein/predicted phosphodiesterase